MHRFEQYSAKYLSKKDSSTMLPELTEFVLATRMGIVRKVSIFKMAAQREFGI
jgi:hypothetical protein